MEVLILSRFWYLYAAIAAAGLSVGIISYRKTYPPIGTAWRVFLGALRAVVTILIGILLIEPLVNLKSERAINPRLAVLVDDSRSMGVLTDGISRIKLADSLVTETLGKIPYPYDLFSFSSGRLDPDRFPGETELTGDATSITESINSLIASKNSVEYRAVLLVTDGRHNLGGDPVDRALATGIPFYTLTMGEKILERNIGIEKIIYPASAFTGDSLEIEAEISAAGINEKRSKLSITENGKNIANRLFDIPSEGRTARVVFNIPAPAPGNNEYVISAPALDGESETADNSRTAIIRILKNKVKIFLGAADLDWEFKFLKQALSKYEDFDLSAVYPVSPGRFSSPGIPRGLPGLQEYDIIILVDCAPLDLRISKPDLENFISGGGSFIFIAGSDFRTDLRSFGDLLPVSSRDIYFDEGEFIFQPVYKYRQHPAVAADDDPDKSADIWNSLPPIPGATAGLNVSGETLIEIRKGLESSVSYPFLTIKDYDKGRIAALTGFPIWRSYFSSVTDHRLADVIPGFWHNLAKWISSVKDSERFKVLTDRRVYRLGEPVNLTAFLNDESNAPKNGALISISIFEQGREVNLKDVILTQSGQGIYRGSAESLSPGKYKFKALASAYGDSLGSYEGEFIVEQYSVEMISDAPDYYLTQKIADVTGGKAYTADNAVRFGEDLVMEPFVETRLANIRPFGMPLILIIIVTGLCVEWAVRKRLRLP